MTDSKFKVGDKVRRTRPHSRLEATAEYTVDWVSPSGRYIHLAEVAGKGFNPAFFELVPQPEAPPEAEKGVFVCVRMDQLTGEVVKITGPRFDYWVDAEKEVQRALKFRPGETFGVLKLLGTVSMKPVWEQ